MVERMYHPEDVKLLVPHRGGMHAVPMDRVTITTDSKGIVGYLVHLEELRPGCAHGRDDAGCPNCDPPIIKERANG